MSDHCNGSVEIWDLPDEVLSIIFSYLSVKNILSEVVDVCVKWREIIHSDAVFWKKLRVVIDCDKFINVSVLKPSSLETVLKEKDEMYIGEHDLDRVSNVQCMRLENGYKSVLQPSLMIQVVDTVSKSIKNLEKIEFSQCTSSDYNDALKSLNEKYENISEIKFDVSCIWTIPYEELTKFSNLNTIISHDYKFKRSDFYCVIDGCLQLSSLWILFARYIKNDDVIYLLEKKKNSLKELGMGLTLSDAVLCRVKECSCLSVLFFSDARYISDNGIKCLTHLSSLKYISLHRAKLQPSALIAWTLSSTVISQLIVLDLTSYYFKDSELLCQIPQNCLLTFNNNVEEAIHQPYKPYKTHIHWMYSNLLKP